MSTTDVVRITSQQPSNNENEQGRPKADPQCHKRRGVLKAPSESSYQGRRCARCRAPFGRIYNIGASCPRCGHRVCQQCRESRASNDKGTVAVDWLCAVCHKVTQLHGVSGEWMCEATAGKRAARRKNFVSPIDILKRSIRRSWTINGPPTRWSVTRRSPELRIYRSLPARREDYRQVVDVQVDDSTESTLLKISKVFDADGRNEESVGLFEVEARLEESPCGSEIKSRSRLDLNERASSKQSENLVPKRHEEALSLDIVRARKSDQFIAKTDGTTEVAGVQEQTSPRVSFIKPPRILPRLGTPDIKPIVKHGERRSSIPIFRRSSKEFEDIKSPQESAKRSLIPQRYRGSTDDLRRSREDISVPSLIPKLFSPRNKEDRLKRQDSRDEIRHIPKASRRDVVKDSKEEPRILSCQPNGRDDCKTGIKIFRRDSREDVGRESASIISTNIGRIKYSNKEERQERTDGCVGEESRSRSGTRALKRESREEIEVKVVESKSSRSQEEVTLTEMANEQVKVEERIDGTEEKVTTRESEIDETMNERKEEEVRANLTKRENVEEEAEETGDVKDVENSTTESAIDVVGDGSDSNEADAGSSLGTAKKRGCSLESSHGRRMEDFQVVRRKFSKEEYSNLDETDDIPNRRCSSHLSPEASPLSTRSSRYSPRESESEPTPALPRKIGSGDSCSASQRIRDAITRTRRESNSSTRYESSGSESVRLSEPGLHGYADLARRVKFGGNGSGTGTLAGGDEVVHRDSATSAGEDEPHDDNYSRDPRTGPASSQTRTMLRRRRQFDAQGSRRRGRSHARGCVDELQSLQTLHVIGRGGGRQPSPPGTQGQGQEAPIVDYRRLVFISSDSSSGREEDDADSSSGSSSLNGLARSAGNSQGLEDCDWDYFESGVIPLPSSITINTSNVGTDTVNQDWSCCPGRGSSACQACGGSRGANVLPVPVPIPVPVPYPVPVPAALWTGDFAAPSMIGCGPAAEGSLTLRGEPNAPWFAWHPRFSHALHGAARIDPRLTAGAFDPVTFAFRPEIRPEVVTNPRLSAGIETATSIARETSAHSARRERSDVNEGGSTTDSLQDASSEDTKLKVPSAEVTAEDQAGSTRTAPLVDEDVRSTRSAGDIDPVEQSSTVNEQTAQNSLSSFGCDQSRGQKMFRRGDSGSSSGRSSADSSDLEDSASHRFSRVFVVNDDSLTSDNDIEDNEDSDSAREGGVVTLKRVSALPEDEPVILRHVRLLDEDTNVGKAPREELYSNDCDGKDRVRRSAATLEDSAVVAVDNSTSDRDSYCDQNRTTERFQLEASEIYLADSKDCSDSRIELRSVKILDPDSVESSSSSSSTTFYNVDRYLSGEDCRFAGNEGGNDVVSFAVDKCDQVESKNALSFDAKNRETNSTNIVAHPQGPSSIDFDHSIVIPDSLEVSDLAINTASPEDNAMEDGIEEDGSSHGASRVLPSGDICVGEMKLDSPAVNSDKTVIRADKPTALSVVPNGSLNSDGLEAYDKTMSDLNNGGNPNLSLTGESASSETNTGSEVSSDELHEYEVSTIESNASEFGAVNRKLILSRNSDEKIASGSEEDVWRATSRASRYEDPTNSVSLKGGSSPRNNDSSIESLSDFGTTPIAKTNLRTLDLTEGDSLSDSPIDVASDRTESPRVLISVNKQRPRARDTADSLLDVEATTTESEKRRESTNPADARRFDRNDNLRCRQDHSVGDIISSKIHEMFKNVDNVRGAVETAALARHDESDKAIGERPATRQVGGGVRCGGGSNGETERGTARFRSVERRPPTRKDGFLPGSTKDSPSFPSNKYRSLVMITQGAYQPVSVVTSDTTTLLQPDEHQPPQGLAGYFQLALEAAAEPHRNGQGPRRPLMVKRVGTPAQTQPAETEADSGLSVGSASESDDVQSVKSVGSRIGQGASGAEQSAIKTCAGSQGVPTEQVSSQTNDSIVRGRLSSQQQQQQQQQQRQLQQGGNGQGSSEIVILEEGLADDDSWVEEVSHDEEEQGATTATEESSEDEANNLGDREEELRGYHRQAIDFTLHTIVEESCEESEAEPSLAAGSPRKQRPPSASELEKYFFFGLGEGNVNLGSREVDSLSETSSIYSEGLESLGQEESSPCGGDKTSGEFLNSSRLEKYFLSEFLGFAQDRRDSDGSVGSDSEGRPSPEQRRKRLVRARGTGRSHSSSLDNLLALTQSSQNLSSQNSLQDLSLNQDSQGTQSEGSSTETDGAEDQTPAFGTDGQFDTVKRKKKKPRNLGTQSPRVPEDRNKTPEPREIIEIGEADSEMINSEDERSKTPQPESVHFSSSSSQIDAGRGGAQSNSSETGSCARTKQQSRDSGFVGSCDDLLQHQKTSGDGQTVGCQDSAKDSCQSEDGVGSKSEKNAAKIEASVGQSVVAPPPAVSLSRKDSFNNWSSDEETNLMMSKMRQFFKTMVANSNGQNQNSTNNSSGASPAPSPRLSGSSPKMRLGSQNRTKPPQLVYFENELTRLMKTVPGIRDEQVREIVEYLSSEDTWSDSYDSSDYTSSDLEGAGGRRSALQEQISQSCQQIINKFDTAVTETLSDREKEMRSTSGTPQPLGRDTAFVYQKLVQSFTKMAGDGVSSDASSTPHSSPPLIAKVMHHIGSRLVALMHEVSEGGPAVQPPAWRRYPQHHRTPSSASTTEDDDSTSDSTNAPVHLQLPRSKSHDPLLLLNGHPTTAGQEGEEREASDYERFSWRGSFESALMAADSRTKLSLLACSGDVSASASASALAMAAKRRSAGDLLFNPKSFSREQLDRVRSCGSIGGGTGTTEEKIWSNRRRSSVPDANTRGESGASAGDDDTEDELEYGGDPRATTLPRGMQAAAAAAAAATNSLPRLPATASTAPGGSMSMHKAHSVHHFLPQHSGVKSARYRPPGFARNSLGNATGTNGPKRAVSAPGLQVSGSQVTAGKRDNSRSRRQQTMSLTSDDGSSLSEACSTPIIGAGSRTGSNTVDDDMDRGLHSGHLATRASLSSLGARSDSMASVYSGAGEGRWCGSVAVRGEVEFALQYDYKQLTFEVHVTQCRDLAPVDVKRNRSDPYVKVYLLPDKSKSGKRKTKVKKHTLNPVFDETLKFHMSLNGLETRTLWLTVWHSDMFGRNDFLGEVRMPLENKIFDDPTPRWYSLQERTEPFDDPIAYKGEVIVGLKFVPPDPAQQQERERELGVDQRGASKTRKNWSRGALHVLVKEARNLQARAKHSGTCDPFCKSYLLPDKGRSGKQKTGVVRRCSGGSPVWGHTFVYKDVSLQELAERGLELTVWDHDRIASNEFLGGVRFNLGTGKHYGKPVDWMDATGRELSLWQSMLERPNFWVEGAVTLRPNLHNHGKNTF